MKNMIRLLFTFLLGFASVSLSAQTFNRPTPTGYPPYNFYRYDSTDLQAHYLLAPYREDGISGVSRGLAVIDQDGYLAWWGAGPKKHFDFKYHPSLQQYSYTRRKMGNIWHFFLNEEFELVDSLLAPSPYGGDIHDLQLLDNGNLCIIANEYVIADLSGYTFNGVPGDTNDILFDLVLLEFDDQQNLVWEWKARDHFSPAMFVDSLYGFDPNGFDYLHANAVEEDANGDLLISARTANAVFKIDRSTDSVAWILGGNFSDFTLVNDQGFTGQHDVRVLPNGNISLFDNDLADLPGSRGVVYELDTLNWTATKVHEYAYLWPVSGKSIGSYRILDNDYEITAWGSTFRPDPSVTLVDPNGQLAAEFFLGDTVSSYRAFLQTLPNLPPRPEITCSNVNGSVTLSGPTSNYYLWSTGETTPSITVSDTGTYVLWVDQGIGMMGSEPLYIEDLQGACLTSALEAVKSEVQSTPIRYYDLLGRPVTLPTLGRLYIVEYSDGTFRKVLFSSGSMEGYR